MYGPSAGADDFANMVWFIVASSSSLVSSSDILQSVQVAAMIDLYEASAEPRWLQCALDLQSVLDEKFAESGHAA